MPKKNEKLMQAMEKVRKSGECNMFNGICVTKELLDKHDIFVSMLDYRGVFSDFVEYKKEGENEK